MIFGKHKSEDVKNVEYILYQVKHGVRLDDVLRNLGYEKLSVEEHHEQGKHYRPFEETSELILHFQQRFEDFWPPDVEPLIWVKKKVCSGDERSLITGYDIDCVFIQDVWIDFSELFKNYTFLDNSPCGVLE